MILQVNYSNTKDRFFDNVRVILYRLYFLAQTLAVGGSAFIFEFMFHLKSHFQLIDLFFAFFENVEIFPSNGGRLLYLLPLRLQGFKKNPVALKKLETILDFIENPNNKQLYIENILGNAYNPKTKQVIAEYYSFATRYINYYKQIIAAMSTQNRKKTELLEFYILILHNTMLREHLIIPDEKWKGGAKKTHKIPHRHIPAIPPREKTNIGNWFLYQIVWSNDDIRNIIIVNGTQAIGKVFQSALVDKKYSHKIQFFDSCKLIFSKSEADLIYLEKSTVALLYVAMLRLKKNGLLIVKSRNHQCFFKELRLIHATVAKQLYTTFIKL
jgi:hypothetical protein